jgi:hypothetical protein
VCVIQQDIDIVPPMRACMRRKRFVLLAPCFLFPFPSKKDSEFHKVRTKSRAVFGKTKNRITIPRHSFHRRYEQRRSWHVSPTTIACQKRYNAVQKYCSATGNRTPVSRVTGRDTSHYTIADWKRRCVASSYTTKELLTSM